MARYGQRALGQELRAAEVRRSLHLHGRDDVSVALERQLETGTGCSRGGVA